jgi:hypothetical protein
VELQQQFWFDLNRMWWDVEDRRVGAAGECAQQLAVAQKAVERALVEARCGRLVYTQFQAARAAVEAAMEGV